MVDDKIETVLHSFLPSSSFPSDHSALSMGIAIASLLWGLRNKDRKFIWFGIILIIFSLIYWVNPIRLWVSILDLNMFGASLISI